MAEVIKLAPVTLDIGLNTAAYIDPLLEKELTQCLHLHKWFVVEVVTVRAAEELVVVQLLYKHQILSRLRRSVSTCGNRVISLL